MLDIRITGGDLIDGTGSPARKCDVGIVGDSICDVGDLSAAESRLAIDATGRIVCPGFIDAHSHSDTYLLIEPSAPSKIFQGIATEVVGNCGASAAPLIGESFHFPSDWRDKKYPGEWRTVAEYRALLESAKPAVNVALLIGHNTLRTAVAGYDGRRLSESELRQMTGLFERSLDEGGRGLSTGLLYAPGMFAPREELIELAKIAAARGGVYTSHMRSEGRGLLDAIMETISIGQASGVRVEISHLKTSGKANWHLIDCALQIVRQVRSEGVEVAADRYPYTSACTDLDVIFPDWAQEGGREATLRRLREPAERTKLRDELLKTKGAGYWETITIASTSHPDNVRFRGMKLAEAAKLLGMEPVDAVLHFAESDGLKTSAFFFGMSEENMMRILAEPYVMLGTDASLRAPTGPLSADYPHPRAYGSFPRFLRMSLDGKTVPLPEAIRKMTSLPARQFGMKDRGAIAKGMKADIVVFDPKTVADTATYSAPHSLAVGVEHLLVNGIVTLSSGRLAAGRGGRFL